MNLPDTLNSILPKWGICSFNCIESNLLPCRAISKLPENPKSVIVAVFPYLLDEESYTNINVSKYSVVCDYHNVVMSRLEKAISLLSAEHPSASFKAFADNSPVPEVYAACRAGLGVRGRNGLLITPDFGSYVFIGEIVTDIELEASDSPEKCCLECGKCIGSCPANALSDSGFRTDACLSGITQKKSELTDNEKLMIKNSGCAWGCDICQDVCPMNNGIVPSAIKEFTSDSEPHVTANTEIENRAFAWRGPKIIQRNLEIIGET